MKPSFAIAAVIVAVLATVVIEEYRIKNLQAELQRLRALPRDTAAEDAAEDGGSEPAAGTPSAGDDAELPDPVSPSADEGEADAPAADGDEESAAGEAGENAALKSIRQVPEDFPSPDDEAVKAAALSPYSDLYYDLGLNNRERSYFGELLDRRTERRQALAMKWVEAAPAERDAIEDQLAEAEAESRREIEAFLNRESDVVTFSNYDTMRPARELVVQARPLMDQMGVALERDKERKTIAAVHEARSRAGSIDWESIEGLKRMVAGDAPEVFDEHWEAETAALKESLPGFLDEQETEAFLASREQLGRSIRESLASGVEQLAGESE